MKRQSAPPRTRAPKVGGVGRKPALPTARPRVSKREAAGAGRPSAQTARTRTPAPAAPDAMTRRRALRLLDGLKEAYPDARCELDFSNALEALVASILAAQCTDARVNMVTPALFRKYRTPQDYLDTPDAVLQDEIRSTGFFNNKTRAIKAACRTIVEKFNGVMPRTMEELVQLPGVGRKTANVILVNIYQVPGVVVDTHMLRLSNRMGFSTQSDADKVERDMMAVFPEAEWRSLSHLIAWHGRRCCTARKPQCDACPVADDCLQILE